MVFDGKQQAATGRMQAAGSRRLRRPGRSWVAAPVCCVICSVGLSCTTDRSLSASGEPINKQSHALKGGVSGGPDILGVGVLDGSPDVQAISPDWAEMCTVTLIGKRLALTAGHCLMGTLGCVDGCWSIGELSPAKLRVRFADGSGDPRNAISVDVAGAAIHPKAYPAFACQCPEVMSDVAHDLALLFLADTPMQNTDPPAPVPPLPIIMAEPYGNPSAWWNGLDGWLNQKSIAADPAYLMVAGYGKDSKNWCDTAEVQSCRGRDVGTLMLKFTTATDQSAPLDCSGAMGPSFEADALEAWPADGIDEHGFYTPGVKTRPGDSGGALLLGSEQTAPIDSTPAPTPMPAAAGLADQPHLVGVTIGGILGSIDWFAKTYTTDNSSWIQSQDRDWDGIANCADNCPDDANPDQYDADGDGAGDACDDCPCDPSDSTPGSKDGDGRCGACSTDLSTDPDKWCEFVYCPVSAIDTCPNVNNDDNANCNADAESATGARVLADACDPVPCPRFNSQEKGSALVSTIPMGGPGSGFEGEVQVVASYTGLLEITPIGAHYSTEMYLGPEKDPASVPEVPIHVDGTEYRYCFDIPGQVMCSDPGNTNSDGKLLSPTASRQQENHLSVWHRILIDGVPSPSLVANPVDPGINPYLSGKNFERVWEWESDFAWWAGTWWGAPLFPYGVPSQAGQGAGRLCLHAQTLVGMDSATANSKYGIHGRPEDPSFPQKSLANAFQSATPVTLKTTQIARKVHYKPHYEFDMRVRPCRFCGIEKLVSPLERVSHPDWGYPLLQVPGGSFLEAQRVVSVPNLGIQAGVLLSDGAVAVLSDAIGTGLKASFAAGLHWVDAAETDPAAGIGARAPSALGLSADGTTLVERMYLMPGAGLLGQTDLRRPIGDAPLAASATQAIPGAREQFQAVYSRSSRRLFLVGGRDATTHLLLGDIWVADIDSPHWRAVPLHGHSVGDVLAATYSPRDRRVWILDVINGLARLTAVTPGSGETTVFGTWPRTATFDKHWLQLDRDGSVLFVASSGKVNKHVVIRIDTSQSPPAVQQTYAAPRALAIAPLVDSQGYAFTREVATSKMPVTIRLKNLTGGIGHWGDIGTCL